MGWYDDYPDNWDQIRKAVYKRDNYTCQSCGARGGPYGNSELHADHIRPKSKGGSHHRKNLRTLCWRCHNARHDHHVPRMSNVGRKKRSTSSGSVSPGHSRDDMDQATKQLHDIYLDASGTEATSRSTDSATETTSSTSKSSDSDTSFNESVFFVWLTVLSLGGIGVFIQLVGDPLSDGFLWVISVSVLWIIAVTSALFAYTASRHSS